MPEKTPRFDASVEDGQLEIRLRSRLLGKASVHLKSLLMLYLLLHFSTYFILDFLSWLLLRAANMEYVNVSVVRFLTGSFLGALTAFLFRRKIGQFPLCYYLSMTTVCYFLTLLVSWPISLYGWFHFPRAVFFVLPDLGIVYPYMACMFLAHLIVTSLLALCGRKRYYAKPV